MKNTFASVSFGCRVNEAEKQQMDSQLLKGGFVWTETNPSVYIINSCAVTGKAEREVRQHIYQIRKKYPKTIILTTGCAATLWTKNNTTPFGADYFITNDKKYTIPEFIRTLTSMDTLPNTHSVVPDKFLTSGRLMVKIQEGCNRFCSYCIVPFTRGKAASIPIQTILRTINQYKNIHEVILTAINTEAFGKDTGESFTDLVDTILEHTTVERLSFGSIHPWSLTDHFFQWYASHAKNPRIVQYFHVPIQSGSDRILRLMNRGYTSKEVREKIRALHSINPHALIATDIIVGFPGETDKEFQQTYTFFEQTPISKFHIFRYSVRPGTAAEKLINSYEEPKANVKIHRSTTLSKLGSAKYISFISQHLSHTYPAYFLKTKMGVYQEALLDNQVQVLVKTKKIQEGTIRPVTIQSIQGTQLYGV